MSILDETHERVNSPRIQDCRECGLQPTLSCDTKEHSHQWNIAHTCPDGKVSRGARYFSRDEVIREWNRQQIRGVI